MKVDLLIIAFLLLIGESLLTAQESPMAFLYQGTARNAGGDVLDQENLGVRFRIKQGSGSGTVIYSESHVVTTSDLGHFAVNVGEGDVLEGVFSAIDWSTGDFYLEVAIDPSGGNSYEVVGTNRLLSVPFALYAAQAGSGSTPDHEWDGTMLRFQKSDGTWGEFVDLRGLQGETVLRETKESKDRKGTKESVALKVTRVIRVRWDLKARRVHIRQERELTFQVV